MALYWGWVVTLLGLASGSLLGQASGSLLGLGSGSAEAGQCTGAGQLCGDRPPPTLTAA